MSNNIKMASVLHTNVCVCFLLVILGTSSGFFFPKLFGSDNKWNALNVRFGINPFTSFKSMPRTAKEAVKKGFSKVSDCSAKKCVRFRGARYVKDGDESLVLLYDVNGYIAGMQIALPNGLANGYPEKGGLNVFVKFNGKYYVTVYFVEPDTICTKGRTAKDFKRDGTGKVLIIQNGPHPDKDYIVVPAKEKDTKNTKWFKGKCFTTMGVHYWHNLTKDLSCDTMFPIFTLYNKGKLNAFGFYILADLRYKHYEHPPKLMYGLFSPVVPKCLYSRGQISTMHVFLTSPAVLNLC